MSNWSLDGADIEHLHDDSDGRCTEKGIIRVRRQSDGAVFTVTIHKNSAPLMDADILGALQAVQGFAVNAVIESLPESVSELSNGETGNSSFGVGDTIGG